MAKPGIPWLSPVEFGDEDSPAIRKGDLIHGVLGFTHIYSGSIPRLKLFASIAILKHSLYIK